jgi:hypothetical protein
VDNYERGFDHSVHANTTKGGDYESEYRHVSARNAYPGTERVEEVYKAGPFSTQGRAMVAADALAERVQSGRKNAQKYYHGER